MGCCKTKCWLITSSIVGALFVILGGISVVVFDALFETIILQESVIEPGTTMYDAWKVVTTPTYMNYYFYNVTNAEEFLNQEPGNFVKPVLQELGPYTFNEYLEKDHVDFLENTNPQEVFYRQKTVYVWDPENSVGNLDDQVTTLNVIAASIVPVVDNLFAGMNEPVPDGLYTSINLLYKRTRTNLLFTHSVNDLLFGFQDDLFDQILELVGNAAGIDLSDVPDFGYFSTSNISAGWPVFQVYTGKGGTTDLANTITHFQNESVLSYWGDEYCNMLNGTDGTSTPPLMTKDQKVYFFIDQICRSLYSEFVEEVTIKDVPAWKFSIPAETFQSPLKNPDNLCYCPDIELEFCKHDGGMPLSPCMAGAPVFVSAPHFLHGDGFYFNQSEGLCEPLEEWHGSDVIFEPNTGAAIQAFNRLQINILLIPNEKIDLLSQIDEMIVFPVVWLNETGTVGDEDAELLYGLLVVPAEAISIIQIVLCIAGSILFLITPFYYLIKKGSGGENKQSSMDLKTSEVYENKKVTDNNNSYSDTKK